MEHKETIHSEDRLNGRKNLVPPPKRSAHGVKSAFEVEVRIREAPFRRPGTSKNRLPHLQRKTQSDRLLGGAHVGGTSSPLTAPPSRRRSTTRAAPPWDGAAASAPGFLERDPEAMWAAACEVARKVLSSSGAEASTIAAVA
jgi:hypothetical protein